MAARYTSLCLDPAGSFLSIDKTKTTMLCLSCAYKPGPKCGVKTEQGDTDCKCLHRRQQEGTKRI